MRNHEEKNNEDQVAGCDKNTNDASVIEREMLPEEEINNAVMQSDNHETDELCHSDSCLIDEMPNSKESNILHCYIYARNDSTRCV